MLILIFVRRDSNGNFYRQYLFLFQYNLDIL